ncbi:MAG: NAD(P)/FAD-dependent oxidoreductase [Prevotella sp.]|nr:NAD(P)/FAD-dependent oxidoreductase [Prevotella sp.]
MHTAIIGGGAAGFFLAVNLKEMLPKMNVTIFEQGHRVLKKVEISGGGRCNCTNSFEQIKDLSIAYPRGHRLMKRLFNVFNYEDAYQWYEQHGVKLTTQADGCVFPASQDAHSIVNCLLHHAHRYGVNVCMNQKITSLEMLKNADYIVVTTGGSANPNSLEWLETAGHGIEKPVPSLFTFNIEDKRLQELMGTVINPVTTWLPSTKFRAEGALLITHWGLSGPAILKLSSHAARWLNEQNYQTPVNINWCQKNENEIYQILQHFCLENPKKSITATPYPIAEQLTNRLWNYLVEKTLDNHHTLKWGEMNKKKLNRLTNTLCNTTYDISRRSTYKEEFVTCGGISLQSINPATLESKSVPQLFFAGEVLDIDGITGGFNFQAAWTTAYTVAKEIARRCQ